MKICARCNQSRPIEDFHRCHRNNDGRLYVCKYCIKLGRNKNAEKLYYENNKEKIKKYQTSRKEETAKRTKMRRQQNPDHFTDIRLRSWYGINKNQYDAMVLLQCGKCKICDLPKKLVVDHDHATGEVRGLLCSKCNSGLGLFEENTFNLQRAIGYLKDG